jgi:hypothetical protein
MIDGPREFQKKAKSLGHQIGDVDGGDLSWLDIRCEDQS